MRIDDNLAKIINWIDSMEIKGKEGGLIEIRDNKLWFLNKENTLAVIVKLPEINDRISFYTDDFPGVSCEVFKKDLNIVFSWRERNKNKRIVAKTPTKSNYIFVQEAFIFLLGESENWSSIRIRTKDLSEALEESLKVVNLIYDNGLKLIQIDPRGVKYENEFQPSLDQFTSPSNRKGNTKTYTVSLTSLKDLADMVEIKFGVDTPILVETKVGTHKVYIIFSNLIPLGEK